MRNPVRVPSHWIAAAPLAALPALAHAQSCPLVVDAGVGGAALAQIFTQRILDHVSCVYSSGGADPNGAAARTDKINMIRHTTPHEATHANRLAPDNVERFGGHHYRTGSGCVMDQSSTYSTSRGSVRFATPLAYCGPNQFSASEGRTALGAIQCEDPGNTLDQDNFTLSCLPATP